ncbi:MAG TPA: SDR family oxidoreductase [Mycobacteriales bacterium]|jgi:NAD(P)-dependent dehydrogenase (short-subunit alcohol dehydrogenase family)|nr:SDR family oxidoreductase [Mycobacteriales bacterium]
MKRSVVVTGANSGIGLATAVDLAAHGYDVIGTVRSDEKGALLRDAAAEKGAVVRYVVCDVADAASVEQAFTEVFAMTAEHGVWAVVNNAGYGFAGPVEEVTDEAARDIFETNVLGPMRICRLVLPGMRERGQGRIVNVSSIAGRVVTPLTGWYCASKHALEALSDALRQEVGGFGVKVILVEPGGFGTGIWNQANERLPEEVAGPYAAAYERARGLSTAAERLPDPIWVARTIRLALATPYPLARYLIGVDAVVGTVLDTLAPTAVADYVKAATVGLRKLPLLG